MANIKFHPDNDRSREIISSNMEIIKNQAKVKADGFLKSENEIAKSVSAFIAGLEIYLCVEDLIDINEETKRLKKDLEKLKARIDRTSAKLVSKEFLNKAPEDVREKEKKKFEEYNFQISKIEDTLKKFEKIS